MNFRALFIAGLLLTNTTFANESLNVGFRQRVEDNINSGSVNRDQISLDLKFDKELDDRSCLSISGRISSGGSYNSTYSDSDKLTEDIHLRNIYLDFSCLREKTKIQVGSLQAANISPTDLDKAGWLDGIRISIDTQKYINEFTIEAGSINQLNETDVIQRVSQEALNFIRIKIKKEITEKVRATLALSNFEDDYISQIIVDISMQEITTLIDSIKIFTTTQNNDLADTGFVLRKSLYGIDFKAGYTKVNQDVFPSSGFNTKGENNVFLSASKTYKKKIKIEFRVRKSEIQTRYEARIQYKF